MLQNSGTSIFVFGDLPIDWILPIRTDTQIRTYEPCIHNCADWFYSLTVLNEFYLRTVIHLDSYANYCYYWIFTYLIVNIDLNIGMWMHGILLAKRTIDCSLKIPFSKFSFCVTAKNVSTTICWTNSTRSRDEYFVFYYDVHFID